MNEDKNKKTTHRAAFTVASSEAPRLRISPELLERLKQERTERPERDGRPAGPEPEGA